MDIGKAFSFVFEDEQWIVKVLIAAGILLAGVLLSWLVIPAFLAYLLLAGYGIEITRRVLRGESTVLPAWENWGQLFTDGVQMAIIGIVYALPIILFSICLGVPLGIASEDSEAAASIFGSVLGCLNFLWGIVMSLLLPAAVAFFVKEGNLAAAFRFGEVFAFVRDNFATYVVVAVMAWVASVIGGLGFLLCGIGWLFTVPYGGFVTSYLYGQGYLKASGQPPQAAAEEQVA